VKLTRKTQALWALVLFLLAALYLPDGGSAAGADLPFLAGIDKSTVTRV
jgi:hypothetical protein